MQVDATQYIWTLKRAPLKEEGEFVTVGSLLSTLVCGQPTGGNIAASVRKQRFALGIRLVQATEAVELTDAEIKMIEELLQQSQIAAVYGEQLALALEGKPNPLAKPKLSLVENA